MLVNRATSGLENATRPTKTSSPCRDEDTGVGTISFLVFNLYKRRWIMLAALSLVVFSNAMVIHDVVKILYSKVNLFGCRFFNVTVYTAVGVVCNHYLSGGRVLQRYVLQSQRAFVT